MPCYSSMNKNSTGLKLLLMKNFLLPFLVPFFAIYAINLENFYQIEGDTLINAQG